MASKPFLRSADLVSIRNSIPSCAVIHASVASSECASGVTRYLSRVFIFFDVDGFCTSKFSAVSVRTDSLCFVCR